MLKLQIVKKMIAVTILFASIPLGLVGMCWGRFAYSVIAIGINTYYTKRIIGLGLIPQMMDVFPYLIASAVMGGLVFGCIRLFDNCKIQLIIGILMGILFYGVISLLFFRENINGLKNIRSLGNG